jgi:hypothetical protein
MHAGAPFAKKGGSELALPKMDVPISLLEWEVFLPEQYKVKDFGGDAVAANLLPLAMVESMGMATGSFQSGVGVGGSAGTGVVRPVFAPVPLQPLLPGQLGGFVVDPSGAVIANAQVTVVHVQTGTTGRAMTDGSGHWIVSNMPSGPVKITATAAGFQGQERDFNYDASRPITFNSALNLGATSETITVNSTAAYVMQESRGIERELKKRAAAEQTAASANVLNLQRRVSGVLPVSVEVPKAGNSYRFVRPLVVDEETKVTFAYKSK